MDDHGGVDNVGLVLIGWSQHQDTTSESELVMSPSIPGVKRNALAVAIHRDTDVGFWLAGSVADVAIAHIAALHECACDREHDDEWVEVDEATWDGLPNGARRRREWVVGVFDGGRRFVHRDDLPDPDAARIDRMAKAIHAADVVSFGWDTERDQVREKYRTLARAALAVTKKENR